MTYIEIISGMSLLRLIIIYKTIAVFSSKGRFYKSLLQRLDIGVQCPYM